MIKYNTLENTSIKTLYKSFSDAFSDYQIKLDLSLFDFQQMLLRRGYISDASMGAFKNDELVGFLLNGIRKWNGKLTSYDTGTAVLESHRKQGITSNMFLNIKQVLKELEVEQYLLEVIQSNTSAVQLYKKSGFEILRNLDCFNLRKDKFLPIKTYKVEQIDKINENNWMELTRFWDFMPSWQNSIDSISAVSDTFIYSVIKIDGSIRGYGIVHKVTGDIPQIAVDKNFRGKGIGRNILSDLLQCTESDNLKVLNVDSQCISMKNFLNNIGFEQTVSQYEMLLPLCLGNF